MKVIRVVSELDFGGVEQVLANSVPELAAIVGIEVQVIVLGKGGRVSQALSDKGIQVLVLNQNPRIPNLGLIFKLSQLFKKDRPNVVHCQGGEANFHGILAGNWAGIPTIIGEEIGIPNHHSYWKYIFRWVYGKANQIIAISEAVKESMVRLGEVKEEKVKVIYNPVSSRQYSVSSKLLPKKSAFVFVTTCRLVPIKNLDRLIQAFAGLVEKNSDSPLLLRVVGDGPERTNLEFIIQNSNLKANVEMVGFQSNVWSYLWEADAFILPSLREGSSVSLAEAMTAGLPSIVTKIGGAVEVLAYSNSGILINPLDTTEIQQAMQTILDLPDVERKEMGLRAQEEAKRFSVKSYLQTLLGVYHGN